MIRTVDLSVGYQQGKAQRSVQQHLNIHARRGELIALIGPNGCGKSTLLRTLAGLQEPLKGSVQLQETNLKELKPAERARQISLVLTDAVQLGYVTVEQLVAMGRHPYTSLSGKLSKNEEKLIREALKAVKLEAFGKRLVSELSDGEKQRVMIAKALAQDTPVIMLDEPTSFLDLPNRVEILLLLRNLAREMQKCILLSTHEIDLAIRLADQLWLMNAGEPLKTGTPAELTADGSIQSVFQGDSFGFDPRNRACYHFLRCTWEGYLRISVKFVSRNLFMKRIDLRHQFQKLKKKFQLTIFNESTLENFFSLRASLLDGIFMLASLALIVFFLSWFLMAHTPLRAFLPQDLDPRLRQQMIQEAERVDSLSDALDRQAKYLKVINGIISGNIPMDSLRKKEGKITIDSLAVNQLELMPATKRELKFRAEYEDNEKYNLSLLNQKGKSRMSCCIRH